MHRESVTRSGGCVSEVLRVAVVLWSIWGNVQVRNTQWLVGMLPDGIHNMVSMIHDLLMSSKSPTLSLLAVLCYCRYPSPPRPHFTQHIFVFLMGVKELGLYGCVP